MENKFLTLQTIYNMVKNNPHPTTSLLQSNELILRQNFPWDEVVNHLNELQAEGLVIMKQLSVAAISITDKGLQYMRELKPVIFKLPY
jgi:predicted transcriptional regulator